MKLNSLLRIQRKDFRVKWPFEYMKIGKKIGNCDSFRFSVKKVYSSNLQKKFYMEKSRKTQ